MTDGATWWCGLSRPYARAFTSNLASPRVITGHPFITAMAHGAGSTQRPRPFSRRLSDGSLRSHTLIAVFGRYTDLLSADMGVRIIYRSTDSYTVTKTQGWGAYYIRWRIIFKVFR